MEKIIRNPSLKKLAILKRYIMHHKMNILMKYDTINARISPEGRLDVLSKVEVNRLLDTSQGGLYKLFRNCSLAVLSSGNCLDDGKELLERYQSFDIRVIQEERGIKLEVKGAPASAFVDGKLIRGINEHLFAVLRDVIYVSDEINDNPKFDLESSVGITNAVFHILRNANIHAPDEKSASGCLLGWTFDYAPGI